MVVAYLGSHWRVLTLHYRFSGLLSTGHIAKRTVSEIEWCVLTVGSFGNVQWAGARHQLLIV